jgi:uncharacterized membrane protein
MAATTAQTLTDILATEQQRVQNANKERQEIISNLQSIIASAHKLLADLGEAPVAAPRRGRPARTQAAAKKTGKRGRPKGFKMSAAARRKMSQAAKKRWAEKKKGEKK